MAVNLETIHRALAAQIRAGIARDTNVYPFPVGDPQYPCVSIYPGDGEHIDYLETFGPAGTLNLYLRLKLEVTGDAESVGMKLCDYLSVGTDNNSSVVDAIHNDKTLGGVVEQCVALTARQSDPDSEPGVAWIPVRIVAKKVGAKP